MDTPIFDFLKGYQREGMSRFHMPGHKGAGPLGCEALDLTEIKGADSLYEADGIIAQSEANATQLFGTRRTFYSAGGSTQCVKAMLYLALTNRGEKAAPVVLAARNVHKSFVFAAGLLGFEVEWLWPEEGGSLCACPVTVEGLEKALSAMEKPPMAVYITSPDYLGNMADVAALADVAHRHGTLLLVDNAHGAYLHFLDRPMHPMDLGADLCCDSAHKTLPVLTGGAYLHISKTAPRGMEENARTALSLFGSTSPSYLVMASLDLCNGYLEKEGREDIRAAAKALSGLKTTLAQEGWTLVGEESLKLTLDAAARGWDGRELADLLRVGGVECEYSDPDYVVLMASGNTRETDLRRLADALNTARPGPVLTRPVLPTVRGKQAMSIRRALLAPHETIPADRAPGRICAAPTVSCPPAIPIAVTGEVIGPEALTLFHHYGVEQVQVVKE